MEINGNLDSSGFITTVKQLCTSKSLQNNRRTAKKHHELKLLICDLLTIKINGENRFYNFRGLSVNIVNIYGVVTEVVTNRFGELYKVDDGTGIIGCWNDNRRIVRKEKIQNRMEAAMSKIMEADDSDIETSSLFLEHTCSLDDNIEAPQRSEIIEAAEWLQSQIQKFTESDKKTMFVLGDTVSVRGKLSDFRGDRCIRIYNIRLVTKPNEEIYARFELNSLYERVYSKLEK